MSNLVARLIKNLLTPDNVREWLLYGLNALRAAAEDTATGVDDYLVKQAEEAINDDVIFGQLYDYTVGALLHKLNGELVTKAAFVAPQGVPPVVWALLTKLAFELIERWLEKHTK